MYMYMYVYVYICICQAQLLFTFFVVVIWSDGVGGDEYGYASLHWHPKQEHPLSSYDGPATAGSRGMPRQSVSLSLSCFVTNE